MTIGARPDGPAGAEPDEGVTIGARPDGARDDGRDAPAVDEADARGRRTVQVVAVDQGTSTARRDTLAVEEPLEIRLAIARPTAPAPAPAPAPAQSPSARPPTSAPPTSQIPPTLPTPPILPSAPNLPAAPESVAVTMRTPGDTTDFELAAGFLFGEGIVDSAADIVHAGYCLDPDITAEQRYNVVTITLREGLGVDLRRLERNVFASSACGVCGKARLDQLELQGVSRPPDGPFVDPAVLGALPDRLRAAQALFARTGGLHAAGLFDAEGELLAIREDVGRHNAVDKLVGWALAAQRLPLSEHMLLVSGRSSFEIMQKALRAGLPIVCAVSAPSSLAVELAERFGMTLVGFLRGERFNVYAGRGRIGAGGS